MPSLFTVTTTTNTVRLDKKRQGEAIFTVSNTSGRRVRGRALLQPDDPQIAEWFSLEGETERDFPIAGTERYTVKITVPADAPAGSYPFRLDTVGVERPDEDYTRGQTVTVEVSEVEPEKKPFPTWIPLVAVGVILLGVFIFRCQVFGCGQDEFDVVLTRGPMGSERMFKGIEDALPEQETVSILEQVEERFPAYVEEALAVVDDPDALAVLGYHAEDVQNVLIHTERALHFYRIEGHFDGNHTGIALLSLLDLDLDQEAALTEEANRVFRSADNHAGPFLPLLRELSDVMGIPAYEVAQLEMPITVREAISKREAEEVKSQVEAAGAEAVELQ